MKDSSDRINDTMGMTISDFLKSMSNEQLERLQFSLSNHFTLKGSIGDKQVSNLLEVVEFELIHR